MSERDRQEFEGERPDVVLFDAGGTLVLIDPGSINELIAPATVDPERLVESHYRAMAEFSHRLLAGNAVDWHWWIDRFFDLSGLQITPETIAAFAGGRGIWHRPIPGALEAVRQLRAKGCTVAVVSNSDGTVADSLVRAGFGGLFELVVDSHETGVSKPDPRIFAIALERLEAEARDTWYVGDSVYHDVGGAAAAGLSRSVLVDPLSLGPPGQPSVASVSDLPALIP